ncbi:MAG: translation elongation factor 4 [bacterium]
MKLDKIRNFSIIAHIDHGKSTLADRMLEVTATVEKRKMKEQVLDQMELERERGITIKMQPVRMDYKVQDTNYELNLIDTPGHIDFSYEVSRALKAVEGVVLLVDATQGVQAQTFTVLGMAQELGLVVIPVLNKIDLPAARVDEVREEVVELLHCDYDDILAVSGKTGEGVDNLLEEIVKRVPPPKAEYIESDTCRALVFDFEYSTHRGVIVFVRLLDGEIKNGDQLLFSAINEKFVALEVGHFKPQKVVVDKLQAGEIGYIVTGIRKAGEAKVGDTITRQSKPLPALSGYMTPRPVVWASVYPEGQDDFTLLKQSLERLKLSDSSLSFEEESSGSLGRGFRCGFLGMLHLEIVTERLRREFSLTLIVASPTISYDLVGKDGKRQSIYSPQLFPEETKDIQVFETWVKVKIILPPTFLSPVIQLLYEHEANILSTETFGLSNARTGATRSSMDLEMPLREMMRNFFDEIKSVSSGYASFSYQLIDTRPADVVKLDILINDEVIQAFSKIVSRRRAQEEAEAATEKLKAVLPRQLINIKIQAKGMGRILAARSISAMRKDVTDYLYGGDITRKMKLREKQKKGKKKMQKMGKVSIPQEVFLKMMKSGD